MTSSRRRYPRTARLNEALLEVLADELERLSDPRLELVTITGVDVSRDLSHARVYYSTLAAEAAHLAGDAATDDVAGDAAAALAAAAPHFRGVLGRQLRIRQVPQLVFEIDSGIVAGQRIDAILRGEQQLDDEVDG